MLRAARLEDQVDIREKDGEKYTAAYRKRRKRNMLAGILRSMLLRGHRSTVEHQTSEIIHHQH